MDIIEKFRNLRKKKLIIPIIIIIVAFSLFIFLYWKYNILFLTVPLLNTILRFMCVCLSVIGWWFLFIWMLPNKVISRVEKNIRKTVSTTAQTHSDVGAYIGILERTIIFTVSISMFLYGIPMKNIMDRLAYLFLGLFGIKGLYRFQEKEKIDWILIGTMLSLLLGLINTLIFLTILPGFLK